jgi:hypothetical protein
MDAERSEAHPEHRNVSVNIAVFVGISGPVTE